MAIVELTRGLVTATGTTIQPMWQAADVSMYDQLELQATLVWAAAGGTPITAQIWTGMDLETEQGWYQAANFPSLSSINQTVQLRLGYPQTEFFVRLIRWRAVPSAAVQYTLYIRALGRTFG